MAKSATVKKILDFILRWILAGVFIYAGIQKVMDPAAFMRSVESYQLVPTSMAMLITLYLPWLEIIAGGCLLIRRLYRGALLWVGMMLVMFMVALASAWWRGLAMDCGCFGASRLDTSYPWVLFRDMVLMAITVYLFWYTHKCTKRINE